MIKNKLFLQVLLAIFLAFFIGGFSDFASTGKLLGFPLLKLCDLLAALFLNALNLTAVPLVCSSIILGSSRLGHQASFTTLGAKTLGIYFFNNLLAVLTGTLTFFWFYLPFFSGALSVPKEGGASSAFIDKIHPTDVSDTLSHLLLQLIPANVFAAASEGRMISLILFCMLFGFFLSKTEKKMKDSLINCLEAIFQVMMSIANLLMKALPFAVFALIAKVIATTGLQAISSSLWYFLTAAFALSLYSLVILPCLLLLIAHVDPKTHFRSLFPAVLTAFSTSSSVAALSITFDCLENKCRVPSRISSFSIPLGLSLNMAGGALNIAVSTFFIASVYGIDFSPSMIATIALMSLFSSLGIAGIPSASLISVGVILAAIAVPQEGIGLILAVDRILDMLRTAVNVLGNATSAVLIAKTEKNAPVPITEAVCLD